MPNTTIKAVSLMKKSKSASERATTYATRIKESLKTNIITKLTEQIASIDDKIFDLENFDLSTDLNAGKSEMTKKECEKRFAEIIELNFQKELLEAELKSKQATFDSLFS